jgi:hypothetical protein
MTLEGAAVFSKHFTIRGEPVSSRVLAIVGTKLWFSQSVLTIIFLEDTQKSRFTGDEDTERRINQLVRKFASLSSSRNEVPVVTDTIEGRGETWGVLRPQG